MTDHRERLVEAVDGMTDAVLLCDHQHRILYANPAFSQRFEWPGASLIGRQCSEILTLRPETSEPPDPLASLLSQKTPVTFAAGRLVLPSTEPRNILLCAMVPLDGQNVDRIVVLIRESTALGAAEEAVREREEIYRAVFEDNAAIKLLLDPDTAEIVDANPAATTFYGYPRELMRRMKLLDLSTTPADDLLEGLARARSAAQTLFQVRHRTVSGDIRDVEIYSGPIRVHGRTLLLSIIHDVTERAKAAAALRASEARLRDVVEKSSDAIYVVQGARYVMVNLKFVELLGYSREELQSPDFDIMSPLAPESRRVVRLWLNRRRQGAAQPHPYNVKIVTRSGEIRDVEATVSETEWDGQRALLGVLRDVTQSRSLEIHLQQAQRMESVGRLAGGVAHDFNNLLTAIHGHAELALLALSEGDPIRLDLEEIIRTSGRAANLTRQLLTFSRRQIISPRIMDLNSVIVDMDRMLRRIIGEDVELVARPASDLDQIKADPGQIEQVIVNLAVNARDAMPKGGRLTIETANVTLDDKFTRENTDLAPGRHVVLIVSDTGWGMTDDVKTKAFDPFFTTKPAGVGTGLGLSTVYGIVRQGGGHIEFDSDVGKGTTFRIYFPVSGNGPSAIDKPVAKAPAASGHETILVVEDNDGVREMTVRALRRFGYEVLEAANAEEALRTCRTLGKSVDLVLTDIVLPNMNGRELAKRLRRMWTGVKILYMTGYAANNTTRHGSPETHPPHLQKPFGPQTLAEKVREALDQS